MSDNNNSIYMQHDDNNSKFNTVKWIAVDGERQLATLNLVQGNSVYGEKLVGHKGEEYRIWDPFRSKLAGALKKGLKNLPIQKSMKVLYLGASTGTTVSHISDIVGSEGIVFAVEPAIRVARELIENVASRRGNVVPIIEDARKPDSYFSIFWKVDIVYSDIAQSDQTDIAIANCHAYLKKGGTVLVVIKTRSIDVTMEPKSVVAREARRLQDGGFHIHQIVNLDPFDKDHSIIQAKYDQI
jgi:fibrillarin-like pre-rRNA processing protein